MEPCLNMPVVAMRPVLKGLKKRQASLTFTRALQKLMTSHGVDIKRPAGLNHK